MIEYFTDSQFLTIFTNTQKEIREIKLLFYSMQIPFEENSTLSENSLRVPVALSEKVIWEVEEYIRENDNWPPPKPENKKQQPLSFHHLLSHVTVVTVLLIFHRLTTRFQDSRHWFERGKFSAKTILSGEWERTVTALTLHLDDSHLLSNFFGLLLFVSGVSQYVGVGVAWFLVLLSGALGNYINALFYQQHHFAVGASTAIFGAVGVMGVFAVKQRITEKVLLRPIATPLIGAFGLLIILGMNLESDVMAHLFGFVSGVIIGAIAATFFNLKTLYASTVQWVYFFFFSGIIVYCWMAQLSPLSIY